jgi:hypothetical protein
MRASLAGAAGAWGLAWAAATLSVLGVPALVGQVAVAAGVGLSALVVAHALAYVVRPAPAGGPCCGQAHPRQLVRRPVVQSVLALPAAFGLTLRGAAGGARLAAAQTALEPPPTQRTAVFRSSLTCPGGCECRFRALFGYDFTGPSAGPIRVTRLTMRWEQESTGTCVAGIERGGGAFDFQCAPVNGVASKVCKLTGGNIWSCACETTIQFLPQGNSSADDCKCPNDKNRNAYAQGLCGPPIWIEKACAFEWITLDFKHKVTCSCPDGHITRGYLTVLATFRNGDIEFAGDWDGNLAALP